MIPEPRGVGSTMATQARRDGILQIKKHVKKFTVLKVPLISQLGQLWIKALAVGPCMVSTILTLKLDLAY